MAQGKVRTLLFENHDSHIFLPPIDEILWAAKTTQRWHEDQGVTGGRGVAGQFA